MLDTIKVGLLRLDTKGKPYGYMRMVSKEDMESGVQSYFQIPLHVVFDKEGYDCYKDFMEKKNTEFKTWVHDVTIKIPPVPSNAILYPNAGHEWFLGNLRDIAAQSSSFPSALRNSIEDALKEYAKIKKELAVSGQLPEEDEYEPPPMDKAQEAVAYHAVSIYGMLQRSRFDPGRPDAPGEFALPPFVRNKEDKTAKEVIEEVTEVVSNYIWKNPKVSKYSETEGSGLKVKLAILFLECFYKEQIRFVKAKLRMDTQRIKLKPSDIGVKPPDPSNPGNKHSSGSYGIADTSKVSNTNTSGSKTDTIKQPDSNKPNNPGNKHSSGGYGVVM